MRGIEVLNNASYDNAQSELNHDMNTQTKLKEGLYDKSFEHDNCGIGAVVNINGINQFGDNCGSSLITSYVRSKLDEVRCRQLCR